MGARIQKKELKKAIEDSRGVVSVVARRIGVSPEGLRQYLIRNPDMKARLEKERETLKDLIESKFIENVEAGKEISINFALKTLCRDRGYGESLELTGDKDKPLVIEVNLIDDSSEPENQSA